MFPMIRWLQPFVASVILAGVCLPATSLAKTRAVEKRWIDDDGFHHISVQVGPSPEARALARKESVTPHSSKQKKREKVRDTDAFDHVIENAARKHNIPAALVRAVIVAESNFDPAAVSHAGAQGLMQLMPRTALEMFVDDPHDPAQNIHGGTRYLRFLSNMFDGDFIKVVAAYNAGPTAVRRYKGIPPYAETQDYVRKVTRLYKIYTGT